MNFLHELNDDDVSFSSSLPAEAPQPANEKPMIHENHVKRSASNYKNQRKIEDIYDLMLSILETLESSATIDLGKRELQSRE